MKRLDLDLPADARSLMQTPRNLVMKSIGGGSYYHFGIAEQIQKLLEKNFISTDTYKIKLQINVDGIPIFKSSNTQLWPILGKIVNADCIPNANPFVIGIFCGQSKPADLQAYLHDFVEEVKFFETNLLDIPSLKKHIKITIVCFVCDAPARAFLKQTKGRNAYYGCERCAQKGVWKGKVTFPETNAPSRTNENFASDEDHVRHSSPSPLTMLSLGLVSQFVLDPVHLVFLGVVKRLLWLWSKSPIVHACKITPSQVRAISEILVNFQSYIPREFNRKCRSLHELERWKATELRQFMLYSGIVALKKHLAQKAYNHFLLFYVAIFFCSSQSLCKQNCDLAELLLKQFVEEFHVYYGDDMLVYNVHSLIHLVDDVRRFGCLDSFSAFKFESLLGQLKKTRS